MKITQTLFVLAICSLLLTACPFATTFPLGEKGEYEIKKMLLGTWTNKEKDVPARAITIAEGSDDNTYSLTVDKPGKLFMASTYYFDAWITELGDKTFLVLQEVLQSGPAESYFVYEFNFEGVYLVSREIAVILDMTTITSVETYREQVSKGLEDDRYFLGGELLWKRKK